MATPLLVHIVMLGVQGRKPGLRLSQLRTDRFIELSS